MTSQITRIYSDLDFFEMIPAQVGYPVYVFILNGFKDSTRHYQTNKFVIVEVFYDGLVSVKPLNEDQPPIEVLGLYCTLIKGVNSETQPIPKEGTMSNVTHAEMVKALAKPGQAICESLTPETAHNLHMAVGISGEAGELLDAVKKAAIYCKPIDRENVIEELGDLEFYMEGLRQQMGITREQTLEANIKKLEKRYAGLKYTDVAAQARADKQENAA